MYRSRGDLSGISPPIIRAPEGSIWQEDWEEKKYKGVRKVRGTIRTKDMMKSGYQSEETAQCRG